MPTSTARQSGAPPTDALVRALMDDAETGMLLLDPDAKVADINEAAVRMLGLGTLRVRGTDATPLLRTVVVGDDLLREAFSAARTEREAVLHTPKGIEVPVLMRSYRLG